MTSLTRELSTKYKTDVGVDKFYKGSRKRKKAVRSAVLKFKSRSIDSCHREKTCARLVGEPEVLCNLLTYREP